MQHGDGGWTLIELVVVLLISAVLAAVAIPTFYGSHRHASDAAAMAELDDAVSVLGELWAEDRPAFPPQSSLAKDMEGLSPNLQARSGGTVSEVTPPAPVVVSEPDATMVVAEALGAGQECLYVVYNEGPGGPGPGTSYAKAAPSSGTCPAPPGLSSPAPGWQRSWADLGL